MVEALSSLLPDALTHLHSNRVKSGGTGSSAMRVVPTESTPASRFVAFIKREGRDVDTAGLKAPDSSIDPERGWESLISMIRSKKPVSPQIEAAQRAVGIDSSIVAMMAQTRKDMAAYCTSIENGREPITRTKATENMIETLQKLLSIARDDIAGDINFIASNATNVTLTFSIATLARQLRLHTFSPEIKIGLAETAEANMRMWNDDATDKLDRRTKWKHATRVADLTITLLGNLSSSDPDRKAVVTFLSKLEFACQKYSQDAGNAVASMPNRVKNLLSSEAADLNLLNHATAC